LFLTTTIDFNQLFYGSTDNLITKKVEFEKVKFKLDCLDKWIDHDAFETIWEGNEIIGIGRSKIEIPNKILYENKEFLLEINHSTMVPFINPNKKYLLDQESQLIANILSETTLDGLSCFIDKIQDFFVFVSCRTVTLNNPLQFSDGDFDYYYSYRNPRRIENTIEHMAKNKSNDLLFNLNELMPDSIQNIFCKWFELYGTYEYALKLLISCLNQSVVNSENRFINLMYALDTIQQKDVTELIKKSAELSLKDSNILIKLKDKYSVDDNLIGAIRAKLTKQNRPKLKDKIAKLLIPYKEVIEKELKESFLPFIELIVNTRNFIAHESNVEPKIITGDFEKYNRKLEVILIMIFLTKLDLCKPNIITNLMRMDKYKF